MTDADCMMTPGSFCDPYRCDNGAGGSFRCVQIAGPPNGTPCGDGLACTCDRSHADANGNCTTFTTPCNDPRGNCNDVCRGRRCVSDFYWTCTCAAKGDRACHPAFTCCGTPDGCVNLNNDPKNCGSCGNNCGAGVCANGACM
jgi:hypothetical protein